MVAGAKDVAIDITPAEPLGIGSRCTIRLRIDGDEHVLHARLRADTAMEIALLQSGGVFAFFLEQIGRASCRERGCVYVCISGCADSIKNKQIKRHTQSK